MLEIGAGLGVLTEALLARAGRVVAIEKDARLAAHLRRRFGAAPNFELIEADALEVDLARLSAAVTKVVSNLPYASASRLLVELAGAPRPVPEMVVTLQRDVARRLAAPPGTKERGALTVLVERVYDVTVRKEISPSCFTPPPQVWSALVCLRRREPRSERECPDAFRRLVQWAFSHRRKQLGSLLRRAPPWADAAFPERAAAALERLNISCTARAENLTAEQWRRLAEALQQRET